MKYLFVIFHLQYSLCKRQRTIFAHLTNLFFQVKLEKGLFFCCDRSSMAKSCNVATLSLKWKLDEEWSLAVQGEDKSKRVKWKILGQVNEMKYSNKFTVEGETDQPVLKIRTTQQEDNDPFYVFQASKLDFKSLNLPFRNTITKDKKGKALSKENYDQLFTGDCFLFR